MKYIYLLLSTIFLSFEVSNVNAQILTGNYTINGDSSTQGRNFATFTEAINALNTYGIDTSTGVIFYVATGQVFNERPPALTASGGFLNRIVFTKLGLGDNPKIKPNIPGNNTIFFQGNFGDGVFRIAGADNILIQHIDIDTNGNYINAWEAYDYGYMLLRRNASDACKNVTIQNCKIQLSPSIVHSAGVFSGAFDTTGFAPIVLSIGGRMENVLIKGIEIWDAYHGIQVIGFQDLISPYTTYDQFVTIDSNTINRFGGLATLATGININYVNFATIKNNTINSISTAADIYGIRSSLTYSASYSILNNSISLINSSGVLCAISCTPLGNVITHNLNISYNKIFNCNGAGSQFFGINASGTFNNAHVSFNQIFNNYNTGLGETYLIRVLGPFSVFNNKIYNNSVFNSLNNATCFPFLCGTSGATSFYNNEIHNITHLGANTGVLIANRSNSSNFLGYNNFIHSLYTPNSTGLDAIRAIELNGATNQRLFFNTIYLDAISNSSFNYGNSALHIHQSNNAEIRNNIIANRSTPGPSGGIVAAYRRSQGSFVTYNFNSNNNCFFVDTNFSRRTIFFNVTDTILNFQAYQTLVGPVRDSLSVFALPPFINILTAPYDLRLSTLTSPVVAAGSPVSTPLITQDIFGNIRSTTNPDIGAYEVSTVLPVQLSYFRAYLNKNDVFLNWSTALEINNKGFFIERSADGIRFEPIGFVSGYGNSNRVQRYAFTDENPFGSANVLYYRLKQVDFDAVFSYSPVVLVQQDNNLLSNAVVTPNPFTSEITIECNLSQSEVVQLQLFSMNGTLVSEQSELVQANNGMVHWDNLEALPLGIYFLRIKSANQVQTIKMIKQ